MKKVLDIKCETDIGNVTIKNFHKRLLLELWTHGEGFSGKRPFGNSGWEYEIYAGLVKEGVIEGTLDEGGYVEEMDTKKALKVILKSIKEL